jgi:TetR/AcrR family transcriptional repressor of nem operon
MDAATPIAEHIVECTQPTNGDAGYVDFGCGNVADRIGVFEDTEPHQLGSQIEHVRGAVARGRQDARECLSTLTSYVPDALTQLQAYVTYCNRELANPEASLSACALLSAQLHTLPIDVAREIRGYFCEVSSWLARTFEYGERQGNLAFANSPRVEAEAFLATAHGAMLSARALDEPDLFGLIMERVLSRLATT